MRDVEQCLARSFWFRCGKRIFDVVFSIAGLIFSFPFWVFIVLAIVCEGGPPIFFRKRVLGFQGRPFDMLKFRTMSVRTNAKEGPLHIRRDDPQITWVGQWLRRCALDELPQLLNILRGDMSVVGPRAWRHSVYRGQSEIERIVAEAYAIVRPGLTGFAQVYGHYYLTALQKSRYDRLYVRSVSMGLDLLLVCKSILRTLQAGWQNDQKADHRRSKAQIGPLSTSAVAKATSFSEGGLIEQ